PALAVARGCVGGLGRVRARVQAPRDQYYDDHEDEATDQALSRYQGFFQEPPKPVMGDGTSSTYKTRARAPTSVRGKSLAGAYQKSPMSATVACSLEYQPQGWRALFRSSLASRPLVGSQWAAKLGMMDRNYEAASDEQLMAWTAEGERRAFDVLVGRHLG